jgi:16S rRNA (guanine527-N7)-methyltransferase
MVMTDGSAMAERAAEWAGVPFGQSQGALLREYADWLVAEAIPAGGLGPREAGRLWARHLADSLTFASGWEDGPPAELLDVGSGVGLPGIPLAILWPETLVTVLDRGGRRTRLLHRAVRILALPNVVVAQADVFAVADEWEALTFRGAVKPQEAVGLSARLLVPGGTAVLGLSRRAEPPERARDLTGIAGALGMQAGVREVPVEILDGPAWLLIMTLGA